LDFYPSAFYPDGQTDGLPDAYSRQLGRGARDGYVSPVDTAWDSDWSVRRTVDGKVWDIAFKRRFCKGCGTEIRRGSDGLLSCSCGRVFSGLDNDWPITTRYLKGKK
jgi:hypothetical protein